MSELFSIVAPVFVMTAVGAVWGRLGKRFDTETVGSLVLLIGTPCLIYSSIASGPVDLTSLGNMTLAALLALAVAGALSFAALRAARLPATVLLSSLMHPNSGNIGIPIVFLAFGDPGLALAVSYFFVVALSQYTVGFALASGGLSWGQVWRQPLVWAIALSLAAVLARVTPPDWVVKTTALLGGITIPLMLLLLGVSLSRLTPRDLPLSLGLAVARLGVGVVTGLAVVSLLGLEGPERGAVFLLASMPVAVFNFIFAERFGRQPDKVASLVFVSTLLTFALMPLLVWVALRLAGQ